MAGDRPVILVDPHPRTLGLICDAQTRARLEALGELVVHDDGPMPAAMIDEHLPRATLVIGQTDLPAERLDRAPALRAVINVEGNFLPNIDYARCFARGIRVLNASPAFSMPVAEAALGMAIDLARGITAADRAFRAGRETYGLEANAATFHLTGAPVGIIGFGDLARALRPMLAPFGGRVRVHDPWLPERVIRAHDAEPADLDTVLSSSQVIFVFAAVTTENTAFLGAREFALIPDGAAFLLMSRAGVVDFPALVDAVKAGRFVAATDVFPDEPVAPDDPVRGVEGLLLSAHRTGGTPEAFREIGRLALSDAELVLRGLPPQSCKRAEPETVGRLRSKPVEKS
ncbi:MAG: hydroxyacid dehydrogenase [Azospirillaceae bacterium]